MRLRSLATLIAFFFLAAMISHSSVSTMVLGVTPVILSKLGVVAHPAVINDRKRIDAMLRITVAPDTQRYATQVQLPYHRGGRPAVSGVQQIGKFSACNL